MYHKRSMSLDTGTREHLIQSVRSPGSSFELSCSSEMLLRMPMTSPQQQQQHVVDVERIAVAVVDMIQYRCTKAIACFLWDLLRYAIFLHVSWILGWALLVALNGFTTAPLCGNRCTIADRVNETLPWHAPDAFFFYLILYVLVLLLTYYLAARRWLTASQHLASRLLKLAAIALLAPAYLSHVFWGPVIFWYANVPYLDFDPTHALLDHQSPLQPLAALKLPNGTMVHLRPSDVALVGNGPLSAEQRAFLRRSAPDQVYRFNGMTNLLPDEPVGHLFVRRIDDVSTQLRARGDSLGNNAEAPRHLKAGDYWGLAPALHRAAVIEWLYVPGVAIVRQRTMCSRAVQAVEVILLNGTHRDAGFYSNFYGLPVRIAHCEGLCKAAPPSGGGSKAPGGWTSGFLGLLEVLDRKRPVGRVHLLGMNFGAAPNNQHATHVERRFVQMLTAHGRVVIHRSPSAMYHSEIAAGNKEALHHLTFPTNLFVKDTRIQGMRCGEWNVWWAPQWQWSPQTYYMGVIPLPPFFHPGTTLKTVDAEGDELPDDYDPLNCTQLSERVEAHDRRARARQKGTPKTAPVTASAKDGAQDGAQDGAMHEQGRRLSIKSKLRRMVRAEIEIEIEIGIKSKLRRMVRAADGL